MPGPELSDHQKQIHAIGADLVAHINSGAASDAPLWDKHYDPSFSSVEADGTKHTGREAVQSKHDWWYSAHTVHSVKAAGPYCGHEGFTVILDMDVEAKDGSMPRMQMKEIGVYTVNNGKITNESFHYSM